MAAAAFVDGTLADDEFVVVAALADELGVAALDKKDMGFDMVHAAAVTDEVHFPEMCMRMNLSLVAAAAFVVPENEDECQG